MLKALVVDDIYVNRFLIGEILDQLKIEYEEAENGKDAIEKIEKSNYSIVFMDIEMPVMNGIEATKYINEKISASQPQLRIVGVTAHDPRTFFEDFKGVTFDGIITKPYTLAKIKDLFFLQDK